MFDYRGLPFPTFGAVCHLGYDRNCILTSSRLQGTIYKSLPNFSAIEQWMVELVIQQIFQAPLSQSWVERTVRKLRRTEANHRGSWILDFPYIAHLETRATQMRLNRESRLKFGLFGSAEFVWVQLHKF